MDPVELAPSDERGEPLGAAIRRRLERLLGRSLADVRVHDDPQAERLTRQAGAQAFAVGRHVYLRPGGRAARTAQERGLLAHEVAHTTQQTPAPPDGMPGPRGSAPLPGANAHLAVQRTHGSAPPAEQAATAAEIAAQAEPRPAPPAIDPEVVAERVYQRMLRDLELDRERHRQDFGL